MININQIIADELSIKLWQVENTLTLKNEGGTVPFIARYRKEKTGNLDENFIRDIFDRNDYLIELEERKQTILQSILEQGKLTDELKAKIEKCLVKNELEDLYLPYKPKRRTRATIAKEKGLEPLARLIMEFNNPNASIIDLDLLAKDFISEEKGVANVKEALAGASDILAEEVADKAELRSWLRNYFEQKGTFVSAIKDEFEVGSTKYEFYRNYEKAVKYIPPHSMLALRRGETEGILTIDLKYEDDKILEYLERKEVFTSKENLRTFLNAMLKDSFNRLMKHSLIGEVRLNKKIDADFESIKVFESNLKQMLLASPAGMKPSLGIDPGFRTGCKVVALDETGKFLEYVAIYPHNSQNERKNAGETIKKLVNKYNVELIAIGNGTAGRETDTFISEVLQDMDKKIIKVIVNESGASIYSASPVAQKEFPDLDLTIRGAISIGRRLMDPLAELVKIDPKSIGVGQYQHDVDQKLLRKKLEETIESAVNFVGVDINTASAELLKYVAGISPKLAENIITYRDSNGTFKNRKQLMKIPKFGDKTFEQCAGFLRIRNGENLLDNTAVHPESYKIVESIAKDLQLPISEITKTPEKLKQIDIKKYCNEEIGELTLKDILSELEKPGRDPRESFKYAEFNDKIKEISDLKQGMELEGVITNITNFGAFADIGVHQDGLIHISEMSNTYVKDPTKIVKVGQIVNVRVLDVNEKLKRITLSMKKPDVVKPKPKKEQASFNINDLKSKFK